MRFGAFVPQGWRLDLVGIDRADQWDTMLEVAKTIESSGYESLWVYDHFHTVPIPTQEVTYEAWTLMAALAVTTDTVRLGQMCTCNGYRNPAYLAKVAANIDVMSGGRLEMGIGGGWYEHEYDGFGYPFPKASVRLGELREAVEIMTSLWTEEEVSYDGTHYQLAGAINQPKPVQDPHIPFWIAGGGEKVTLNIAARYAQYTNFGGSLDEFTHKSEILAAHCAEVGTDYSAIVRSTNFNIICGQTHAEVQERMDWTRAHYAPFLGEDRAEAMIQRNFVDAGTVGTPDRIIEALSAWRAAGCAYGIVYFTEAAYDTSGLELFAREVVPALS
jgi:F420-dependent oxidoreductase-like protein